MSTFRSPPSRLKKSKEKITKPSSPFPKPAWGSREGPPPRISAPIHLHPELPPGFFELALSPLLSQAQNHLFGPLSAAPTSVSGDQNSWWGKKESKQSPARADPLKILSKMVFEK